MSETRSSTEVLAIDWTACDGRGLCHELLPELLYPDPWGYPAPRSGRPAAGVLTKIPRALEGPAKQAVNLCPLLALRLERR